MKLESALELKASLTPVLRKGIELVEPDFIERRPRARGRFRWGRRLKRRFPRRIPPIIGLGISPTRGREEDYKVAIRLGIKSALESIEVEAVHRRARGEVDVRYVGTLAKRQAAGSWYRERQRPLKIGASLAHYASQAGTLGCFVKMRERGEYRILSNNHVLALENQGQQADGILQPSSADSGTNDDVVGGLEQYVPLELENHVDCATCSIDSSVEWDARTLTGVGELSPARMPFSPEPPSVTKLGRTSGRTEGRITAFNVDAWFDYDLGRLFFWDQIEISGNKEPFSEPGDSGALVFSSHELFAVGLLFGGSIDTDVTYANPINAVLDALSADLMA